jgi:transcriptional regulator with XRE-family HTH domain
MTMVKLKIAELRKNKRIGQQDLADVLGVSFQSVSKWENGVTMPDITLLPNIAE